jgi:multiple sugar transport system ATP-binding protein
MRGISQSETHKQVIETAKLLDIEDLLGRKPRELSGGQQQRVAMGRALVRRPRLFLLDEPLSNLDAQLRSTVRLELKRLHRQIAGTIVYVTHDQVEAMTLGDRVVVMRSGKIHQIDPPETIYARPADTFVATFIGSPEMNLYSGRLLHKKGILHFEGAGFSLPLEESRTPLEEGPVELGVRPEDIEIGQGRPTDLQTRVEMLSNVGSEQYVHAHLGGEALTIRVPKGNTFRSGETISVTIDAARVHIFQKGQRISS